MGGKGPAALFASYVGYKGIRGFGDQVVPNAVNSAMDVAFDDPEADMGVLGTNLTPSMLYMKSGLPGQSIARARNIDKTGINLGLTGSVMTPPIFAALGAGAGALIGLSPMGRRFGVGTKKSAAIGGLIGGALGAASVGDNIIGTASRNRQILNQSPFYNQSLLTAERLNASGNIVLGMHNQRRG